MQGLVGEISAQGKAQMEREFQIVCQTNKQCDLMKDVLSPALRRDKCALSAHVQTD